MMKGAFCNLSDDFPPEGGGEGEARVQNFSCIGWDKGRITKTNIKGGHMFIIFGLESLTPPYFNKSMSV